MNPFYMLDNIMPENVYPQLPTAPPISQESFNIEMVRKYYQYIANLKEKYTEKQWKHKNAYNRLLLLVWLAAFQLLEQLSLL